MAFTGNLQTLVNNQMAMNGKTGQQSVSGSTPPPPAPATPTALNSTVLGAQPAWNYTAPKPSTALDGLAAGYEAGAATNQATFQDELKYNREQAAQTKKSALDAYLEGIITGPTQSSLEADAYAKEVDPLNQKLADLNAQMLEEQHSLNRELQALDQNKEGLFGGALEAQKDKVRGESLARQADLAVISLAIQGKRDAAQAAADRYVDKALDRQTKLIEALKLNYEDNKTLFSEAEQRAFDFRLTQEEGALADQRAMMMARFQQILNQNDPLYQVQLAQAQYDLAHPKGDLSTKDTLDLAEKAQKEQTRLDNRVAGSEIVIKKVNEALGQVNNFNTGFIGGFTQYIPGTSSRNLATTIDTIKSRIGFDTLQAMREASPTGGALGQVAVQELEMLQSSIASLDVGQSPQQLTENLKKVKTHYTEWLRTVGYVVAPDGQIVKITN